MKTVEKMLLHKLESLRDGSMNFSFSLIVVFLLISHSGFSQPGRVKQKQKEERRKNIYGIKVEYEFQGKNYGSIGLVRINSKSIGLYNGNSFSPGVSGASINISVPFTNEKFHVIPKLSYEYTLGFLATKINVGFPTDMKSNALLFTPELGLSMFGAVYLFYGYNAISEKVFDISSHKLTLGVNLFNINKKGLN